MSWNLYSYFTFHINIHISLVQKNLKKGQKAIQSFSNPFSRHSGFWHFNWTFFCECIQTLSRRQSLKIKDFEYLSLKCSLSNWINLILQAFKATPSHQLQTLKEGERPDTKEEKVYRRPKLKDKKWPYHWKYVQPSGLWQTKLEWVIVKILKQRKRQSNWCNNAKHTKFPSSFNLVLLWFPALHSPSSNFRSLPKS